MAVGESTRRRGAATPGSFGHVARRVQHVRLSALRAGHEAHARAAAASRPEVPPTRTLSVPATSRSGGLAAEAAAGAERAVGVGLRGWSRPWPRAWGSPQPPSHRHGRRPLRAPPQGREGRQMRNWVSSSPMPSASPSGRLEAKERDAIDLRARLPPRSRSARCRRANHTPPPRSTCAPSYDGVPSPVRARKGFAHAGRSLATGRAGRGGAGAARAGRRAPRAHRTHPAVRRLPCPMTPRGPRPPRGRPGRGPHRRVRVDVVGRLKRPAGGASAPPRPGSRGRPRRRRRTRRRNATPASRSRMSS